LSTNNFSTATTGWIAIATGVAAILAIIFLTLMSTVNNSFGRINDVFNSVIGISSVVLAWMLYAEHHAKSPVMSQVALAFAVVGAIFTIIGSILIIFGFTDFVLAGWYSGIGYALIGLWLAAFCYSALRSYALPHNLVIFGIVAGVFMAIGLWVFQEYSLELTAWSPCHGISILRFLDGWEHISCIPSGQSGLGEIFYSNEAAIRYLCKCRSIL
jgi:hypothetical protein